MNWMVAAFVALTVFRAGPVAAQAGKAAAEGPVARCLTEAQREVNKKLLALDRATKEGEPDWIFNPDYFLGTWNFEWEAPDSVLGSAGTLTGRATFEHMESCYYEGALQIESPDGPFMQKIQFIADPENRWMTWIETDSRGFTFIKSGRMGGDLGGYFTHYWEVPVFTYEDKKVRLKGSYFLGSPATFRSRVQISIDGGPYVNFGTQWFRKDSAASPPTVQHR